MFEGILAKVRSRRGTEDEREIIDWYLEQGFSLIPIVSGKKRAAVKWEKYQSERASKDQVYQWRFIDGYDLGVVCGRISDNLVVVDFDEPKLYVKCFGKGTERDTLVVMTSKKGRARKRHVYFKAAHSVPTRHFEGVDIQGEGAYVKMPPSAGYDMESWPKQIEKWEGDFTQEILEILTTKGEMEFEPETVCVKELFKPAPIGTRHARLVRQVTWMRMCEVDIAEALQRTLRWNSECDDSKDEGYVEYQINYLYHRKEPYHFKFDEMPRTLYSHEVLEAARAALTTGKPFELLLKAVHQMHSGDDELAKLEWVSLIGSWTVKIKINTWAIGESGTGKSHLKVVILELVPTNLYEKFTSTSPMSLFYYIKKFGEWSLDKKVLYIDEVEASKDTLPILRNLTGQTEIVPRHLSVHDAELIDLTVKGKRAVWFTSVRVIGSDQIQKRFVNTSPDDSVRQSVDVYKLQELIERGEITIDAELNSLVGAMTQIIVEDTADLGVYREYYIAFPLFRQRRLYPIFLATLKTVAKIHHLQRERTEDGRIIATAEDFNMARDMWHALEAVITYRVAGKPLRVYESLTEDPEMAMTHSELAQAIDMGTDQVRRYCKELSERNLINSRRRDGQGRPWEYWRRRQPSALDIEMCDSLEAALDKMTIQQHKLLKNNKIIKCNVKNKKDAVKLKNDALTTELLKWIEEEDKVAS